MEPPGLAALSEEAILERLRSWPTVRSAAVLPATSTTRLGLQCTLWCKGCSVRANGRESVQVTETSRTSLLQCMEELEKKLSNHGATCEAQAAAAKCKAAVEQQVKGKACAARGSVAEAAGINPKHDMLQAMMALASAKARAKTANLEALAAEKAKDAVEAEVEALEAAAASSRLRSRWAARSPAFDCCGST